MVLLDRSKLRLKAATAKLKKQRQCNMSRENAQTEPKISHKRHKKHKKHKRAGCPHLRRSIVFPGVDGRSKSEAPFCAFVLFVPFVATFDGTIVAHVKS